MPSARISWTNPVQIAMSLLPKLVAIKVMRVATPSTTAATASRCHPPPHEASVVAEADGRAEAEDMRP